MAVITTTRPKAMLQTTVRMDEDLVDIVNDEAEHRGTTFSEVVRASLKETLFGVSRRPREGRREPCHR
jgi:hypothetical protein